MKTSSRGFTLIELLFVVGIIALISAIVLASLSVARLRAQDTAVKQEMAELRTLMARQMADTGSYLPIKNGGTAKFLGNTCSLGNFSTSNYASQAKAVCDALVKASSANNTCGPSFCVRFNLPGGNNTRFSIEAYLPYESVAAGGGNNARYLCMGSSGNSSISTGTTWTEAGCSGNP
ncbi:MAG TPA: type II secretion system protein [Candidatus Paceibacterota bacterium]|nr:type II secretion system protein [Candidatus Paceibacterota bacterium]